MEEVRTAFEALDQLCKTIKAFSQSAPRTNHYRAPIIDHFHPDAYSQRTVAGLSRFLSHVRSERDYVEGILNSNHPPGEFTTNAPNLLAIWDEVEKAPRPILLVSQMLDIDESVQPQTKRRCHRDRQGPGQIKLDLIADGGNEWIKVSTIKEARLMAEFREQDSYVNSDYDSDSEYEAGPDGIPTPRTSTPNPLTNSLITQARALVEATEVFRRPEGLPKPRVRFVLNRMTASETYTDPRIEETFQVIRDMGVDLVLGDQPRSSSSNSNGGQRTETELVPTRNVLLDLSVLVALCCDSTHYPIPIDENELESRFRALQPRSNLNPDLKPTLSESGTTASAPQSDQDSELELAPHNNVTRDLRDQLKWEMQHSLIGELQTQLARTLSLSHDPNHNQGQEGEAGTGAGTGTARVQFWVTEEVKGRLPNIVDVIGGPCEKARADAMFGRSGSGSGAEGDFWKDSRWKGKAPALGDMRLKILPDDPTPTPTPTASVSVSVSVSDQSESSSLPDISNLAMSSTSSDNDKHHPESESETKSDGRIPPFHLRMAKVCQNMLSPPTISTSITSSTSSSTPTMTPTASHTPLQKQKYRFSRNPNRPSTIFPTPTKAPSGHTLRSFAAGSKRGWTVLTNNRGAVNRVIRDMGVLDGLPYERDEGKGENEGGSGVGVGVGSGKAVVWIVNPNSLSEWRRLEVLESNRRLLEDTVVVTRPQYQSQV